MRVRRSTLLLLGCLVVLGGCRSGQNIALLEQELRLQEDRIYQLQDCLQATQASLDACCEENESLRRRLANGQGSAPSAKRGAEEISVPSELKVEIPSTSSSTERVPGLLQGGGTSGEDSPGLSPSAGTLEVSPGVESPSAPAQASPEEVPAPDSSGSLDPRPLGEGPAIGVASFGSSERAARIDVGHLAVERAAGGAERLSLLVVPRDAGGAPLAAPGPVSVAVVDSAISGPAGRVARWDFSAEQIAGLHETSAAGEGFRLPLAWPGQRPVHKQLHLFVRYETSDGRRLNTEVLFDLDRLAVVEPRGSERVSAGWQARTQTTPWSRASSSPRLSDRSASPSGGAQWRTSAAGPSESEAPAWARPTTVGATSEAPPWNGSDVETGRVDMSGSRTPERVTARPRPPAWSPERQ